MAALLEGEKSSSYIQHYVNLNGRYTSEKDIYKEYSEDIKRKVIENAQNNKTRYKIYSEINPTLSSSPYLNSLHPTCNEVSLGIPQIANRNWEMGRCKTRGSYLQNLKVVGDEKHVTYNYKC